MDNTGRASQELCKVVMLFNGWIYPRGKYNRKF